METNDTLAALVSLAKVQLGLEKLIAESEELVAKTKAELKDVAENKIPALMDELGVSMFKLSNGYTIKIANEYYAKITEENEAACYDWLRSNDLDGIIKSVITLPFGKGEDAESDYALEILENAGFIPTRKESIHHQVLKSFVKERIAKGLPIDYDTFGISNVRRSVVVGSSD